MTLMSTMATTCAQSSQELVAQVPMLYFRKHSSREIRRIALEKALNIEVESFGSQNDLGTDSDITSKKRIFTAKCRKIPKKAFDGIELL